MKRVMTTVTVLAVLLLCSVASSAVEPVWKDSLAGEVEWSKLTSTGTLVVGNENTLAHYASDSGKRLWQREGFNRLTPFNVTVIEAAPFLLVSERLKSIPPKSELQVLDLMTGKTVWRTGEFQGQNLGVYPIVDRKMVLFVSDRGQTKELKGGTYIAAYNLSDGAQIWQTRLGRNGLLPVYKSDASGFIPTMDLSGHPNSLISGNNFILVAGDLYAIDLNSGAEKWRVKLGAANPALKRTYAAPILADGVLYATGKDRLYAIDAASGAEKWNVKIKKGVMPQLEVAGDLIVGRLGGTFSNSKKLVQVKPFGAFAVGRKDGALRWVWTKAKDSITNLVVVEDQGLVVVADKKKLYALDLKAKKKPKVVYSVKLGFKRKMGTADVAAKGLGIAGGLLRGGISGAIRGGMGGDRSDPPIDIDAYGKTLVVRGQFHVLSHDVGTRTNTWSIEFAPPGMNSFALIAMGAVTAAAAYGGAAAGTPDYGATENLTSSYAKAAAARYAASEKARNVAFFMTKEDKKMMLVGIDLNNGEEVGRVPMAEKAPMFKVDALANRIYYFKDKKQIMAYDF